MGPIALKRSTAISEGVRIAGEGRKVVVGSELSRPASEAQTRPTHPDLSEAFEKPDELGVGLGAAARPVGANKNYSGIFFTGVSGTTVVGIILYYSGSWPFDQLFSTSQYPRGKT